MVRLLTADVAYCQDVADSVAATLADPGWQSVSAAAEEEVQAMVSLVKSDSAEAT